MSHWADEYRDADHDTVEYWIYMAACACRGTEERIREVGEYAFNNGCGIWHASWATGKKNYPCPCTPCTVGRGETPVCI
jgi:hypothetical protein